MTTFRRISFILFDVLAMVIYKGVLVCCTVYVTSHDDSRFLEGSCLLGANEPLVWLGSRDLTKQWKGSATAGVAFGGAG